MFFLTLLVVFLSFIVMKIAIQRRKIHKFTSVFGSPSPRHPIMGHLLLFPKDPVEIFKTLGAQHKTFGKNLATFGFLNDFSLQITEPKDVEVILCSTKSIKKSVEYDFMLPWLGTGLLTSFGRKWFSRRKIITPTFHFNILEQFIEVFNRQSNTMAEKLRPFLKKGNIDIYNYSTLCALDIICETSMGVSINAQESPSSEYVTAVKQMSSVILRRIFSVSSQFPWIYPFTSIAKEQKEVLKILHGFTDKVILERKSQLEETLANPIQTEVDEYGGRKKKITFLDMLLQATVDGQPLSNSDIREEVDTFMFEGHDTTTSGIAFLLYNLAENPLVQEKVFEEVRSVFGDDPTTSATHSQLLELKYLEMALKESMRLFPPVPIVGRTLAEDTLLNGVTIPKDVNVIIPVYVVHHDADVFPDPEKFDPERFTKEAQMTRNPYSYIPFSAGQRNCIGQKFAMLEIKSTVSKILRHYRLESAGLKGNIRVQADLILKPADELFIKLENRIYN